MYIKGMHMYIHTGRLGNNSSPYIISLIYRLYYVLPHFFIPNSLINYFCSFFKCIASFFINCCCTYRETNRQTDRQTQICVYVYIYEVFILCMCRYNPICRNMTCSVI
ncbi:mCG147740 [Mus musculus]|nr:mCG147740 [Mus musculus]